MASARRVRLLWGGAVAVVVLAVTGVVLFLTLGSGHTEQAARTAAPAPALSTADASRIAADLASGDAQQLADAVALPPGQALDPAGVAALAQLHIQIDPGTFRRDPNAGDQATVSAQVTGPDGVTKQWTLTLVHVGSTWRLNSSALDG